MTNLNLGALKILPSVLDPLLAVPNSLAPTDLERLSPPVETLEAPCQGSLRLPDYSKKLIGTL